MAENIDAIWINRFKRELTDCALKPAFTPERLNKTIDNDQRTDDSELPGSHGKPYMVRESSDGSLL